RTQAIAQEGLAYTEGPFDRVRYDEILRIAAEMLAACGNGDPDEVERVLRLETGYPTPKVDVRGVVFRGEKMLFVREVCDGLWTLPGGWADAGCTPAEAAVKEIREESGYEARATRLLAVYDRDRQGHPPLQWPVYKLFILCELLGGSARQSIETDGVRFFGMDEIPPLSEGRVLERQIVRMFELGGGVDLAAEFD
ncbi:MAG TPA: NUDIX hydrolase, partial [Longimicrobiaceae bacterium]|nr:NUDIX hydrolase [Longimicrobiaceae bacterium]